MIPAAALLVAALSARPDWVDGMPAAFPRERFLTAVGVADDRATAEARARAGIASFFETRVAAAAQRAPLVQDLRLLEPAAEPEAPAAVRDAKAAAERALAAIAVGVVSVGDDAPRLRTAAARAIVATGMRVVPVDAAHDLVVHVEEEAVAPAASGAWTVVRLNARVRALDARQETVASFVETAKGTSGGAEEATRRAAEALAARVEERLEAELRARLDAP